MKTILIFTLLCSAAIAQRTFSGRVYDLKSKQPLPYASVGLLGKAVGTLSDENGRFELAINESEKKDSLKISCIGYIAVVFGVSEFMDRADKTVWLEEQAQQLEEVVVKPKKIKYKILGTDNYNTLNCTGFVGVGGNWKGAEAAIFVKNDRRVLLESFNFYVIQNKYSDSLLFRLMLYKKNTVNGVGPTLLKKPIIFKLGLKQGSYTLPLLDQSIIVSEDFFISLECLMDEMDIIKFCYSGSQNVPSYFKLKAFANWQRARGGGADFNIKAICLDEK